VAQVAQLEPATADTASTLVSAVSAAVGEDCVGEDLFGEVGLAAFRALAAVAPLQAAAWCALGSPFSTSPDKGLQAGPAHSTLCLSEGDPRC